MKPSAAQGLVCRTGLCCLSGWLCLVSRAAVSLMLNPGHCVNGRGGAVQCWAVATPRTGEESTRDIASFRLTANLTPRPTSALYLFLAAVARKPPPDPLALKQGCCGLGLPHCGDQDPHSCVTPSSLPPSSNPRKKKNVCSVPSMTHHFRATACHTSHMPHVTDHHTN